MNVENLLKKFQQNSIIENNTIYKKCQEENPEKEDLPEMNKIQ